MSTEKKLALEIQRSRKEKKLTQIKLAELAGIEYKHLQLLEGQNNATSPTLRTLEKISNALGLSVSELLSDIC